MIKGNNIRAAERERGLVWASDFSSASQVREMGGTITGTPEFSTTQGVDLDGTNDYLYYNIDSTLLYKTEFSCVVEFTPDFASDAATDYSILATNSSGAAGRYLLYKTSAGAITFYAANTSVLSLAYGTWSDAWNEYGKNILVVSSASGDTSAWLNGVQIATNDASAWTPTNDVVNFYVGSFYNGGLKFDGKIHSVKIFSTQLTDQEGLDYSNGGGFWNYMNEATNYWPLDLQNLATDKFGSIDGTITAATKNTYTQGYNFNGSTATILLDSTLSIGTNDFSFVFLARNTNDASFSGTEGVLAMNNAGGSGLCHPLFVDSDGNNLITAIDGTSYKSNTAFYMGDSRWHVIVVSADRDGNLEWFIDGVSYGQDSISAKSAVSLSVTNPTIGEANGFYWTGDIAQVMFWNGKALTQIQATDAYLSLIKKVDNV